MNDDRKKQIETFRDFCLDKTRPESDVRRKVIGPMLDDCLKEITKLETKNEGLSAIIELSLRADKELMRVLLAAGKPKQTRTICADCGKPSGDRHNCPEQAAANRKAREKP